MHVQVNLETCQGIGLCEAHAPTVFDLGDRGFANARDGEVPPDQEDAVRKASAACPTDSITIRED